MSEPPFLPDDPRSLTILYGKRYATKQWTWNPTLREWLKKSYDGGKHFTVAEVRAIEGLDDLGACVRSIAANPRAIIIRGALLESERQKTWADPARTVRRLKNKKADAEPVFREIPRQWLMIDIDDFPLRACDDLADDPAAAVEHAVTELLPDCFQDIRAFWQLSSSAGFAPGVLKAHLFYWLTTPVDDATLKKTLRQCAPGITDLSPYQGVQPHYVASPIIKGGPDPIPRRFGWIEGMEDAVVLPALKPDTPRTFSAGGGQAHGRAPALEELGDGEGLSGFHLPLRTATLSHARRCRRFGGRDDAALI